MWRSSKARCSEQQQKSRFQRQAVGVGVGVGLGRVEDRERARGWSRMLQGKKVSPGDLIRRQELFFFVDFLVVNHHPSHILFHTILQLLCDINATNDLGMALQATGNRLAVPC